jgi:hypothetical protein
MPRQVLAEAELLEWMNRELHGSEDYRDCEFTSITRLAGIDETGCNWSSANLQGHGIPVAVCQEAAGPIVQRAKQLFNVG